MRRLRTWVITYLLSFGALAVSSTVHISLGSDVAKIGVEEKPGVWVMKPDPNARRIPNDHVSAVHRVAEDVGEDYLERFAELNSIPSEEWTEDQFLEVRLDGYGHHGLGTRIRNDFGLWKDSRLARFYTWRGFRHPDDMSGPILDGLVDYVDGIEPSNLYVHRTSILAILAVLLTLVARASLLLYSLAIRVLKKLSNKPAEVTPNGAPHL